MPSLRIVVRGQASSCSVFVGQALCPVPSISAQHKRQARVPVLRKAGPIRDVTFWFGVAISQGAERGGGTMDLKNAVALIRAEQRDRRASRRRRCKWARVAITGRDGAPARGDGARIGSAPDPRERSGGADVERTYRESAEVWGLDILSEQSGDRRVQRGS